MSMDSRVWRLKIIITCRQIKWLDFLIVRLSDFYRNFKNLFKLQKYNSWNFAFLLPAQFFLNFSQELYFLIFSLVTEKSFKIISSTHKSQTLRKYRESIIFLIFSLLRSFQKQKKRSSFSELKNILCAVLVIWREEIFVNMRKLL